MNAKSRTATSWNVQMLGLVLQDQGKGAGGTSGKGLCKVVNTFYPVRDPLLPNKPGGGGGGEEGISANLHPNLISPLLISNALALGNRDLSRHNSTRPFSACRDWRSTLAPRAPAARKSDVKLSATGNKGFPSKACLCVSSAAFTHRVCQVC